MQDHQNRAVFKSIDTPLRPADPNEADLLARLQAEDRRAQSEVFWLYKDRIFSLCLRLTSNRSHAEDLTQDAFIAMFRKVQSFRGESKFSSWFHRLASNLAIDFLRRQRRLVFPDAEAPGEESFVDRLRGGAGGGALERLELQRALEGLPEGYRVVFVLYQVECYSHEEIAEMLGCSVSTSKTQLFRARKRLRESL